LSVLKGVENMMKNRVHIELETLQDTSVVRYCSQCKGHVTFRDSKVKRHNANGKNIYKYAIYKCDNHHTWNKILDKLDSNEAHLLEYNTREQYKYKTYEESMTLELEPELEIIISSMGKQMRLDKMLHHISQLTRKEVNQLVESAVLVNNKKVVSKYKIKDGDIVEIKKLAC